MLKAAFPRCPYYIPPLSEAHYMIKNQFYDKKPVTIS